MCCSRARSRARPQQSGAVRSSGLQNMTNTMLLGGETRMTAIPGFFLQTCRRKPPKWIHRCQAPKVLSSVHLEKPNEQKISHHTKPNEDWDIFNPGRNESPVRRFFFFLFHLYALSCLSDSCLWKTTRKEKRDRIWLGCRRLEWPQWFQPLLRFPRHEGEKSLEPNHI